MKATTLDLIQELNEFTDRHQSQVKKLSSLSDEQLKHRPAEGAWNVLECIEHLNRYGRFYLPEVKSRLNDARETPTENFKSSWLGNYFAVSMKPGSKPMKTFKEMNPFSSTLDRSVIAEFEQQLEEWQELLELARQYNLSRVKTAISISSFIKLRLGDTLRVVIYHHERHLLQADRATGKMKKPTPLNSVMTE